MKSQSVTIKIFSDFLKGESYQIQTITLKHNPKNDLLIMQIVKALKKAENIECKRKQPKRRIKHDEQQRM